MPEVKIIRPIWVGGKPQEVDTVLPLLQTEADYLVAIGRVEIIAAPEAEPAKKPAPAKKAK